MKKLLILLTITLAFIGCMSFKPQLVEDKFYPSNNYFTTGDTIFNYYPVGSRRIVDETLGISFKTIHGKSNLIMRIYVQRSSLFIVEKTDNLTIKYKDGSTSTLKYTSRVSDYTPNYFYMFAVSKVISEYKDMSMIRVEVDGEYANIEVSDKNNKELRKIFNDMKTAVDDYYK